MLANLAYRVASAYNEVPQIFILLIVVSSIGPIASGDVAGSGDWLSLGAALLVILGLVVIAWRGQRDRMGVDLGMVDGLGARIPSDGLRRRTSMARILLMPFVLRPRSVKAVRNVAYGPAGRWNLLDVYHHRSRPDGAPVLIHFHGGGFYSGRKSFESRELLFCLASQGWVTISANYRLRPQAAFFDHLTDSKRVLAWVREHGHAFGADPSTLVVSGGSAGGTLASIAGLTQNEARYQPGFEAADTSVSAVVSLYGWYGGYYEMGGPYDEVGVLGHKSADAPPFFIAHGAEDSLSYVEMAHRFVEHLRAESSNPVVYAELEHGQHSFDLFRSLRCSAVVDGIETFLGALTESTLVR